MRSDESLGEADEARDIVDVDFEQRQFDDRGITGEPFELDQFLPLGERERGQLSVPVELVTERPVVDDRRAAPRRRRSAAPASGGSG